MISHLLSAVYRVPARTHRFLLLLSLFGVAATSSMQAATNSVQPASVVPGDTFSIEAVGYNTSNPAANIYLINPFLQPTFGTLSAYANSALNGQSLVVNSNEFVNGNVTTDFVSITVPSNFVPAGTRDNAGNTLNAIQFSIGAYLGGTNPLNLSPAVLAYTATGAVTFNFFGVNTSAGVPLTSTLSNGNQAFSAFGLVTATPATADISNNQVTSFSFTLTYASVPEPPTNAAIALGVAGMLLVVVRRRRSARI